MLGTCLTTGFKTVFNYRSAIPFTSAAWAFAVILLAVVATGKAGADDNIHTDGFEACQTEIEGYPDFDNDGYGDDSSELTLFCVNLPLGFVSNSSDCDDTEANVNPGTVDWFSTPSPNGSYDYNCDGVETRRYEGATSGCTFSAGSCNFSTPGWEGIVPACGQSGTYVTGCNSNWQNWILGCPACALSCLSLDENCINCLTTFCPGGQACELEYANITVQECR